VAARAGWLLMPGDCDSERLRAPSCQRLGPCPGRAYAPPSVRRAAWRFCWSSKGVVGVSWNPSKHAVGRAASPAAQRASRRAARQPFRWSSAATAPLAARHVPALGRNATAASTRRSPNAGRRAAHLHAGCRRGAVASPSAWTMWWAAHSKFAGAPLRSMPGGSGCLSCIAAWLRLGGIRAPGREVGGAGVVRARAWIANSRRGPTRRVIRHTGSVPGSSRAVGPAGAGERAALAGEARPRVEACSVGGGCAAQSPRRWRTRARCCWRSPRGWRRRRSRARGRRRWPSFLVHDPLSPASLLFDEGSRGGRATTAELARAAVEGIDHRPLR
jgi:hypothetical protein